MRAKNPIAAGLGRAAVYRRTASIRLKSMVSGVVSQGEFRLTRKCVNLSGEILGAEISVQVGIHNLQAPVEKL